MVPVLFCPLTKLRKVEWFEEPVNVRDYWRVVQHRSNQSKKVPPSPSLARNQPCIQESSRRHWLRRVARRHLPELERCGKQVQITEWGLKWRRASGIPWWSMTWLSISETCVVVLVSPVFPQSRSSFYKGPLHMVENIPTTDHKKLTDRNDKFAINCVFTCLTFPVGWNAHRKYITYKRL